DGDLVGASGEMAIDAVQRDVGGAVAEPFDRDVAGRERRTLHAAIGLDPVDALAVLAPEAFGVLHRPRVHVLVFGPIDVGGGRPACRNLVEPFRRRAPPALPRPVALRSPTGRADAGLAAHVLRVEAVAIDLGPQAVVQNRDQ